MNTTSQKTVLIIQKYLPQYRRDFFERLRECLANNDIMLSVIYGQPGKIDEQKKDSIELPWGKSINNLFIRVGSKELIWQPILPRIKNADLIIVEQASKLLVNYFLVGLNVLGIKKVAFWGHGKNFQTENASTLGENLKRITATRVHWWFTYNRKSTEIIKQLGFPEARITEVQNAIDGRQLQTERNSYSAEKIADIKKNLGITSNHVGLYVGGMYPEKRLDFLLTSCEIIRENVPDFEMIFIGDGPQACLVQDKGREHKWIHFIGPKFGSEKIPFFIISQVLLIPGAVGLVILDSFALEVPIITTKDPNHGPEIEYMLNSINGVMINNLDYVEEYVKVVVELLKNPKKLETLKNGCIESAQKYSIDKMVTNFANGIKCTLAYK